LPRAIEIIRAKAEAAANRVIKDFGNGTQVLNGRYGPYITDGEKNARIPKGQEPSELTAAQCAELIAAAPNRPKRGGGRFGKGAKTAKKSDGAAPKAEATKTATKKTAVKSAAKKTAKKKTASKKTATKKTAAKKAALRRSPSDGAA
jgi:DNA topoisomerase I